MRRLRFIPFLLVMFLFVSCASISVSADYDRKADFSKLKTYAFLKEGIDKVQVSDLDKKRILRAIEQDFSSKGMALSENPDFLVTFFTKEHQNLNLYNTYPNWGWGMGWGGFWYSNSYNVSRNTQGVLFIEIIDATTKELIWQGKGTGYLPDSMEDKEKAIVNFVTSILKNYPPQPKS